MCEVSQPCTVFFSETKVSTGVMVKALAPWQRCPAETQGASESRVFGRNFDLENKVLASNCDQRTEAAHQDVKLSTVDLVNLMPLCSLWHLIRRSSDSTGWVAHCSCPTSHTRCPQSLLLSHAWASWHQLTRVSGWAVRLRPLNSSPVPGIDGWS